MQRARYCPTSCRSNSRGALAGSATRTGAPIRRAISWAGVCPHTTRHAIRSRSARFLEAIRTAATKLGATEAEWQRGDWHLLSSVAEEMAAYGILRLADGLWETPHASFHDTWGDVIEWVFEDIDFLHLWHSQCDGIQDSPVGRRQGIAHLNFAEWFLPFEKKRRRGHDRQSNHQLSRVRCPLVH
jgi:hypothetical protein